MKLTKFVHACLLAETNGITVLFDPGIFSWDVGVFDLEKLSKLDYIVITHEHADHFHEPFVKALVQKFPDARIVTNPSVAELLKKSGVSTNVLTESDGPVEIFSRKAHATLPPLSPTTPENIAVHFADQLTVGGDRHDLEETKDILAFTITAPWGSTRAAAEMVLRLNPKHALPLHDWHWHEQARQQQYDRFAGVVCDADISFIKPVDGQAIEV